jgi:hypothetical protein
MAGAADKGCAGDKDQSPFQRVLHVAPGALGLALGLVGLALGFRLAVTGDLAGGFLDAALDLLALPLGVIFVSHDMLPCRSWSRSTRPPV